MQSEEMISAETLPDDGEASGKGRSRKTGLVIWLNVLTFLLGLGLLAYVIYRVGYDKILESLATVGWGFAIILALNLARHLGRAASLYLAIEPDHRNTGYSNVVAARFGGEAVNFFSFAGPFLGDATRAMLLRKDVTLTQSASAVIIDNILYYLSVILMILAGVATLVVVFGSGESGVANALILIVAFSLTGFAGLVLAIKHRVTPASWLIHFLAKREKAPGLLLRKQQNILDVENNVFRFYHDRKADFFKVFAISLSVHVLSVIEVYLALRFLGYEPTVPAAFITESLTKVINVAFSFIPGTIGVYEGGNGVIQEMLGLTVTAGVALAFVRRGAILFSTVLGLIVIMWRAAAKGARHLKNRQ